MPDATGLILSELREVRKSITTLHKSVAHLEAKIENNDPHELERRIDKLEAGEARRQGMSAALGLGSGGIIAALVEWMSR